MVIFTFNVVSMVHCTHNLVAMSASTQNRRISLISLNLARSSQNKRFKRFVIRM
jgi:hypothetical protein